MASPVDAWRDEHAHFLALLARLQAEVDVFHGGERPDYELMLDIVQRLREAGDRQHHPRDRLTRQLEAVLNGALVPRVHIEAVAATYLVYYGSHIAREEADVLPRAAAALTSADWQAVAVSGPASLQQ